MIGFQRSVELACRWGNFSLLNQTTPSAALGVLHHPARAPRRSVNFVSAATFTILATDVDTDINRAKEFVSRASVHHLSRG